MYYCTKSLEEKNSGFSQSIGYLQSYDISDHKKYSIRHPSVKGQGDKEDKGQGRELFTELGLNKKRKEKKEGKKKDCLSRRVFLLDGKNIPAAEETYLTVNN